MAIEAPNITKEKFVEILKDESIFQEQDSLIFQTIYYCDNHEASATEIAKILGWRHRNTVTNRIVNLGRRIIKKHPIEQREREDGTKAFWDFFFGGDYEGNFFIYKLKDELIEALIAEGIVDDNTSNSEEVFFEGTSYQVLQTRYERDINARNECLKHHGYTCKVCEVNFEERYGDIGHQFIHVHHLNQISSMGGKEYKINPITDLQPVCPNCHAMIHRQRKPLTIEELKEMINSKNNLNPPPN